MTGGLLILEKNIENVEPKNRSISYIIHVLIIIAMFILIIYIWIVNPLLLAGSEPNPAPMINFVNSGQYWVCEEDASMVIHFINLEIVEIAKKTEHSFAQYSKITDDTLLIHISENGIDKTYEAKLTDSLSKEERQDKNTNGFFGHSLNEYGLNFILKDPITGEEQIFKCSK